jgi:hypothetical protein
MSIIHKTAKGKPVDMNKLVTQNELTVAVSNVRINARGDELGPGGQIIHKNVEPVHTGVPVQQQSIREVATPVKPAAPKPAAPKPTFSPVTDSPNALLQPAPESKDADKQPKGKQ